MQLRLRQICLIAAKLEPAMSQLQRVFDLAVCHIDPAVGKYGLENCLLPVGNQFLEIVAPVREGTAGGRYLDRRGGDGGYMVITQCQDRAERDQRIAALNVPVANELDYGDFHGLQLHPKYTGGAFFEIDWNKGGEDPDGPWHPAGPDWQAARRETLVSAIVGVELQSEDPAALAARWAEIAGLPLEQGPAGPEMAFTNAVLKFVAAKDGRGDGLGGLELRAVDAEEIMHRARQEECVNNDGCINICGTRFHLLS